MRLALYIIWFALWTAWACFGEIISSDRRVDWSPGVPGGIPRRTTIATTLSAGATAAQINSALTAAASNSVVVLGAGGYDMAGGTITIPSYKSLRGAGYSTVLTNCQGVFGSQIEPNLNTSTAITGGNTKGSASITVASASGITVGKLLRITQTDQSPWVTDINPGGQVCSWCDGDSGLVPRNMGQTVLVTNVSGTTIGIDPPLYYGYNNSPLAYPYTAGCVNGGLEDLRLYATNPGGPSPNMIMKGSYSCWVTNVESDFAIGDHMNILHSLRCEVRHSYFHDAFNHSPGQTDADVMLALSTSECLIEDNIFWRLHVSVILEKAASGNVVAYNFSTNNYNDPAANVNWMINDFLGNHGAHPFYNLFEGNVGVQGRPDSTWGSGSHTTWFRNAFSGSDHYSPPSSARTGTAPAAQWEALNNYAISIDAQQVSNNVVANRLGSAWLTVNGAVALRTNGSNGKAEARFNFGSNEDTFLNATPFNTAIFSCNYSVKNGTQQFNSNPDHAPVNSYFRGSKPTWFGNCPWPPVEPSTGGSFSATNVPAGYRFYYGVDPPTSGPDVTPPVITNVAASEETINSARIDWDTDEPTALDFVIFNTQPSGWMLSQSSTDGGTHHSIVIYINRASSPPADPSNKTYYYRPYSQDLSGNESYGPTNTFMTLPNSGQVSAPIGLRIY